MKFHLVGPYLTRLQARRKSAKYKVGALGVFCADMNSKRPPAFERLQRGDMWKWNTSEKLVGTIHEEWAASQRLLIDSYRTAAKKPVNTICGNIQPLSRFSADHSGGQPSERLSAPFEQPPKRFPILLMQTGSRLKDFKHHSRRWAAAQTPPKRFLKLFMQIGSPWKLVTVKPQSPKL